MTSKLEDRYENMSSRARIALAKDCLTAGAEYSDREAVKASEHEGIVYLAVKDPADGRVEALAGLPHEVQGDIFFKFVHEEMQPIACGASTTLLGALSPTNNEMALNWRSTCKRYRRKR